MFIKRNIFVCFLIALITFTIGVFIAYIKILNVQTEKHSLKTDSDFTATELQGRVLVILLDAARKDFMFSEKMPFISSCRDKSAWGISEVVSVPLSVAGDHAIFAGKIASPLAVFEDFRGSTSSHDNVFKRVTQNGKRAVILSSHCLRGAYGKYTDLKAFVPRNFLFSQYMSDAKYLFEQSYKILKKQRWDLAVIQFVTFDFIGHLETPRSPNYGKTALAIDEYVHQLIELTNDNDSVLITSEHGMDDNGFHMDRSPMVTETPFLLWGPKIRKSGPVRVLQIDWAPTLSILTGVSPFYDSPALPALDLLRMSPKYNTILLKEFSRIIASSPDPLSLAELRSARKDILVRKGSPFTLAIILLTTMISVSFLAYVALNDLELFSNFRLMVITIAGFVVSIFSLSFFESYSGILDYLSNNTPFSANFILSHISTLIIAFSVILIISVLSQRIFLKQNWQVNKVCLLFVVTLVLAVIFQYSNPYHPLSWSLIILPVVAWGLSRRPAWILIFCAICSGIVIRRLTFYDVYNPIALPERWILALIVFGTSMVFLWWRRRGNPGSMNSFCLGTAICLSGILSLAFSSSVAIRTILLLSCAILLGLASRELSGDLDIWWATWVTLFFLGTSGSINHVTHIAALPLLIAVWSGSLGSSSVVRGILIILVMWSFYLMPGNGFDLKILEMQDRFILSSAMTANIGITALIIASRYVLPVAVLIWGMKWSLPRHSVLPMASTALLPVFCAVGVKLIMLNSGNGEFMPLEQVGKLIVLLGYVFIFISALLIVTILSKINKQFGYGQQIINT